MGAIPAALAAQVDEWLQSDPDPETRAEIAALRDAGDVAALADRFDGRLEFGTAGLRGRMEAGPTRMNRLVVRQSAAGIARYLRRHVEGAGDAGVVVIHDARHRSDVFAADCAEVLAAHGIRVIAATTPLPTPIGVFAIRYLGCVAGIVVTASHNPPRDNGMKLFMGDGAQIVPPVDGQVAACIDEVVADGTICPTGVAAGPIEPLPAAVISDYLSVTRHRFPPPAADVHIALTAMHGVGGALCRRLLNDAGFDTVIPVASQIDPNPDFPTVTFPNPEEPGATDRLSARMRESGAPLGLALDPDADRVAAVVADGNGTRQLTGDEVGALLGEWLLGITSGDNRLTVTSVVSSQLLSRIAAAHGVHHEETLTGFKWLSRPALANPTWTQILAYEESIGYAIGPTVRDKDGLSGALAVASMVASLTAQGRTVLDLLDDLHVRHGAFVTDNFSLRDEGPGSAQRRASVVARLAADPPTAIGGIPVASSEALAADVLRMNLEGGVRVIVRPSGTEPKLKCYCEAIEPVAQRADLVDARARARVRLDAVRAGLSELLGAG